MDNIALIQQLAGTTIFVEANIQISAGLKLK
jgi:hypothetical protein